MKPIEIADQYETTHSDGDTLLGQSETKEGVLGINPVVALEFKGDVAEGCQGVSDRGTSKKGKAPFLEKIHPVSG
jgi:hypothetical protein